MFIYLQYSVYIFFNFHLNTHRWIPRNSKMVERDQWSWKLAILVTHIKSKKKELRLFSQQRKKRIFSFYQHLFNLWSKSTEMTRLLWEIIKLNCLVYTMKLLQNRTIEKQKKIDQNQIKNISKVNLYRFTSMWMLISIIPTLLYFGLLKGNWAKCSW